MNCQECLEELSARSLREMPADSPIMQHCAGCPDCARVTTRLREQEYDAASVLNNLPPMNSPVAVAERAATLSHRRKVGRIVVVLSGIAGALVFWVIGATMVLPAMVRMGVVDPPDLLRTETIHLVCLTPAQAGDVINPYIRSHGSTYYTPSAGIPAITVRGTPDEIARSRAVIHEFDNGAPSCQIPLTTQLKAMQKQLDGALAADRLTGGPAEQNGPVIAGTRK